MGKIINLSFKAAFVLALSIIAIVVAIINRSTASTSINDSKQGIHFFAGSLDDAVALSKKENKPVFLLAHASYCSSCKKMIRDILPLKEVGDLFNTAFINLQVDIESEKGVKIVKDFDVEGTPTLLFLAPDGRIIKRSSGYLDKEELLALAGSIKYANK